MVEVVFDESALKELFESADGPVGREVTRITLRVENRAKRLLSTPGGGRVYRRRGVTHQASAPGEPPAVDTGQLRASITHEVGRSGPFIVGRVGTNLRKAVYLELGTRKMAARPFLRTALIEEAGSAS